MATANGCKHNDQIRPDVSFDPRGCAECLKSGQQWVQLRGCLVCGHVGCCDSSVGKHATAHFKQSSHPVMRSVEPGQEWRWCYVDEQMI